jgi:hypothetical protein
MDYKFIKLEKATDKKHKYIAFFENKKTKRVKRVPFGGYDYFDYTTYDKMIREERKKLYRIRHKNDNIDNPITPGALSWYILWNKPTIDESLKDYLKRFNLS